MNDDDYYDYVGDYENAQRWWRQRWPGEGRLVLTRKWGPGADDDTGDNVSSWWIYCFWWFSTILSEPYCRLHKLLNCMSCINNFDYQLALTDNVSELTHELMMMTMCLWWIQCNQSNILLREACRPIYIYCCVPENNGW